MGDFLYISPMNIKLELTYEERIQWFINKYYETGMEYEGLLASMKDTNLDSFQWYDETISIPKYSDVTLYSEIEHLIMVWSNDGTKTAGHLTRQIMKLIEGTELQQMEKLKDFDTWKEWKNKSE
jgi:hypothetical protein